MLIPKALSDETRVRILMMLAKGELCVCQLTSLLKLAPSTISKHLSILHHARLVNSRKDKRWVYYSLNKNGTPQTREAIEWVLSSLKRDKRIISDLKSLLKVAKVTPEEFCK